MLRDVECEKVFKKLVVGARMGEGSFGAVYLCEMEVGGKIVKLAVKETRAGVVGEQSVEEVSEEAELAYRMAEIGAGPRVYDMFAIKFAYGKGVAVYQYILMRALADGNLEGFIRKQPLEAQIMVVVPLALRALQKTVEAGVECYDVKPANFVYEMGSSVPRVRMIDFGFPHCKIEKERGCRRTSTCRGGRRHVLFVALAAQLLFQLRRDARHPAWVANAAGRNRLWRSRGKIASAVVREFGRNEHLRAEYQWYRRVPMARLDEIFWEDLGLGGE